MSVTRSPVAASAMPSAVTFQVVENAHQFSVTSSRARDHVGKVVVECTLNSEGFAGIGHALGIVEREPLLARPGGLCRNAACRGAKIQKQEFFIVGLIGCIRSAQVWGGAVMGIGSRANPSPRTVSVGGTPVDKGAAGREASEMFRQRSVGPARSCGVCGRKRYEIGRLPLMPRFHEL